MRYSSQEAARLADRGTLSIAACLTCDFVFNSSFDQSLMSYGAGYDSDQTYSPAYSSHVNALLDSLIQEKGVRDSRIIEVGCGKGDFLRSLVEKAGSHNIGRGFDPSYVGVVSDVDGRLTYVQDYFKEEDAHIDADVAIMRHVLEHIEDPVGLLSQVRRGSANARIYLETKDVGWALKNVVVWDFFYEYCSYFSARSIAKALEVVGFDEVTIDHVFHDQYLWIEAPAVRATDAVRVGDAELEKSVESYIQHESEVRARWMESIDALRKNGEVALWGAGAKGGTFASLFDPAGDVLSCVIDLNPAKQGQFIAGSGHAILPPSELKRFGIAMSS